jgi:hypothetical protein
MILIIIYFDSFIIAFYRIITIFHVICSIREQVSAQREFRLKLQIIEGTAYHFSRITNNQTLLEEKV